METTAQKIIAITREYLGKNCPADIPEDATFESLGCDSLDAIEVCMLSEDALQVMLDDDLLPGVKTIADLAALIDSAKNGEAPDKKPHACGGDCSGGCACGNGNREEVSAVHVIDELQGELVAVRHLLAHALIKLGGSMTLGPGDSAAFDPNNVVLDGRKDGLTYTLRLVSATQAAPAAVQ